MAVRKYRQRRGYFRGGAVPDDGPCPEAPPVAAEAPPVEALPEEPPAPLPDRGPLGAAYEAQMRAEELVRDRPPSPSIRANIKALETVDPFRFRAASFHYAQGLMEGVADESPEMTARILAGIQAEVRHQHEQAAANVQDRGAAILPPEPAAPGPTPLPAAIMPPRKRSIPMSAPVSRDIPDSSGGRISERGKIRLSPAEIDISHRSFTADNMTNAQKEQLYARNKMRMLKMRANGELD